MTRSVCMSGLHSLTYKKVPNMNDKMFNQETSTLITFPYSINSPTPPSSGLKSPMWTLLIKLANYFNTTSKWQFYVENGNFHSNHCFELCKIGHYVKNKFSSFQIPPDFRKKLHTYGSMPKGGAWLNKVYIGDSIILN